MPSIKNKTSSVKKKKRTIYVVKTPSCNRLIRADSRQAVRNHLFGEIKIKKASGDEVAEVMEAGNRIEEVSLIKTYEHSAQIKSAGEIVE